MKVNLEKTILWVALLSMMAPISYHTPIFRVNPWYIAFFGLLVFILLKMLNRPYLFKKPDSWDIGLIFLCVSMMISTLLSTDVLYSIKEYFSFLFSCLLALYIKSKWSKEFFAEKQLVILFVIMLFFQGLTGVIQQLTLSPFGSVIHMFGSEDKSLLYAVDGESFTRIKGTLGHPNYTGILITIGFPFLWIFPTVVKAPFNWFLSRIIVGLCLLTILFTISRGTIGIFFITPLIMLMIHFFKSGNVSVKIDKYDKYFFLLIIITVLGLVIYNIEIIMALIGVIETRMGAPRSTNSIYPPDIRMILNFAAWDAFVANPFWGIGFCNIHNWLLTHDYFIRPNPYGWRVHNIYLMILSETGIVGSLCFAYVFFYPFYLFTNLKKKVPIEFCFQYVLVAYALMFVIYMAPMSYQNSPFLLFFLGCAMGYHRNKSIVPKLSHA